MLRLKLEKKLAVVSTTSAVYSSAESGISVTVFFFWRSQFGL